MATRRRRIVLIDDDPDVVEAMGGILRDEGYEVVQGSGWEDLILAVGDEVPDLVLLDGQGGAFLRILLDGPAQPVGARRAGVRMRAHRLALRR